MVLPFFSPLRLISAIAGPEETKNLAGQNVLRLIQIRLATSSLEKIWPECQDRTGGGEQLGRRIL